MPIDPKRITKRRAQRTICRSVSSSGLGLHTGCDVALRFCPAAAGQGIRFRRIDLPGQPEIPASLSSVESTNRCTTIGCDPLNSGEERVQVHTVEHVMAAVKALKIDNLVIELTGPEPPAAGGCARLFVELLSLAGIEESGDPIPVLTLERPVFLSSGQVQLIALPSSEYRVSYTLDYPTCAAIGSQFFSIGISPESFESELAPCRTFALYEELSRIVAEGSIRGGSL